MMTILMTAGLLIILVGSVFTISWLCCSHQIRFQNGYDSELKSDYQTIIQHSKAERNIG